MKEKRAGRAVTKNDLPGTRVVVAVRGELARATLEPHFGHVDPATGRLLVTIPGLPRPVSSHLVFVLEAYEPRGAHIRTPSLGGDVYIATVAGERHWIRDVTKATLYTRATAKRVLDQVRVQHPEANLVAAQRMP